MMIKSKKSTRYSAEKTFSVVGVIPARYKSLRLPGKPLIPIKGKPLIQRVYENASKSQYLDKLLVATDDKTILNLVKNFGGEARLTSKRHKTGTDRVAQAVKNINAKIVINIQCDEAFINPKMIDELILQMKKDRNIQMGTLASKIKDKKFLTDPNLVKVALDKDNYALYFSRYPIPYRRTDGYQTKSHNYYEHIGIYAFRKNFLKTLSRLSQTPLEKSERLEQLRALENGYKIKVVITEYNSFSLNSYADLKRLNSPEKTRKE
jgi:3-deoxy-manno-octulosonate cytidylyltransferase (CMP-KDO synthetase)